MHHAVMKLCKLSAVPSLGSTYKVACDALESVDISAATLRTFSQAFSSILISAMHTAVAVVVHRSVADVVLIHEVHDVHDSLRVVGSIAIDLYIEDVSASSQVVVRSLNLCLVAWRAMVVYWYVVRVCIVILVCHSWDEAELLLVKLGEAT